MKGTITALIEKQKEFLKLLEQSQIVKGNAEFHRLVHNEVRSKAFTTLQKLQFMGEKTENNKKLQKLY